MARFGDFLAGDRFTGLRVGDFFGVRALVRFGDCFFTGDLFVGLRAGDFLAGDFLATVFTFLRGRPTAFFTGDGDLDFDLESDLEYDLLNDGDDDLDLYGEMDLERE